MTVMDLTDQDEISFFRRHRVLVGGGIALALVAVVALAIKVFTGQTSAPIKVQQMTFVKLLPPVPTATPPPQQQQPTPKPQEMIEQKQMVEPETKPNKPDDKPKDEPKKQAPQGPLGLNMKGDGKSDSFGLVGRPGGNGLLNGGGGGGGTRWGWYANQVRAKIEDALRQNRQTRDASLRVQVRIWADSTGRVTRAQLAGSTGNSAIDSAITNEVLTGLQLPEAPPSDMPMPIVLRLTAQRPN
jgi:protein TonB